MLGFILLFIVSLSSGDGFRSLLQCSTRGAMVQRGRRRHETASPLDALFHPPCHPAGHSVLQRGLSSTLRSIPSTRETAREELERRHRTNQPVSGLQLLFDPLFEFVFRRKLAEAAGGQDDPDPSFKGIMNLCRRILRQHPPSSSLPSGPSSRLREREKQSKEEEDDEGRRQQKELPEASAKSLSVLVGLFPPVIAFLFKLWISQPFPFFSARMNAAVTQACTRWLMGDSEVFDVSAEDLQIPLKRLEQRHAEEGRAPDCSSPAPSLSPSSGVEAVSPSPPSPPLVLKTDGRTCSGVAALDLKGRGRRDKSPGGDGGAEGGETAVSEGAGRGRGLLVRRCKFLEESGCVSVCVNLCKRPTEAFFKDTLGLDVWMRPDYSDLSCTFLFGVAPPDPAEDDAFDSTCFQHCSLATAAVRAVQY
uniref:Beta-carotene isomerase D27-like C-terminal domain-containing protein n=1 Tax=Chromera velia CCMP2878 TaxID=1169474 RepID=A0A0G4FPL7_9ALVE|eukprot:Cvel_18009.t1-p1 / transcript=Cvel_18009.t1 / gene=Cvel_18009 / organism=Chromera_velia_CCMP2878 / gene_product=Beta-carotene isomerase D27, chloroplastic, putative / transcript_product=Beta-carotene isomerase D27, chloroplastic, putative / location=Cvel_scaffold1469:1592-5781(+) / protein_length=419 / sequence_SO=supercontig / SO=protein_coding / is_pseudo=false